MLNLNKKESSVKNDETSINFEINDTMENIVNKYSEVPKTKNESWFMSNCIKTFPNVPSRALNGHVGGLIIKTNDNHVLRLSGKANADLSSMGAIKEIKKNIQINGD